MYGYSQSLDISGRAPKWLLWLLKDAKDEQEIQSLLLLGIKDKKLSWEPIVSSGLLPQSQLSTLFYLSLILGEKYCSMEHLFEYLNGDICEPNLPPNIHHQAYTWPHGMNLKEAQSFKLANQIPVGKIKSCDLTALVRSNHFFTAYLIQEHIKLNTNNDWVSIEKKISPYSWKDVGEKINAYTDYVNKKDLSDFVDFLLSVLNTNKTDHKKETSLHMLTKLKKWPQEDVEKFAVKIFNKKPILALQQNKEGKRIVDTPQDAISFFINSLSEKVRIEKAVKTQVKQKKSRLKKSSDFEAPAAPSVRKRRM